MNFKCSKETDLKSFTALSAGISKGAAKKLIDSKTVLVNSKRVWIASHVLKPGDRVEIPVTSSAVPQEKNERAKVIYEDRYIIAADKPAGITADGGAGSLEEILKKNYGNSRIKAVHRLDKETTGAVLFAKNPEVFEKYKKLWEEKGLTKIYYAVCLKEAPFRELTLKAPVDGKSAVSHVKRVAKANGFTLFRVRIETGRKHQIRIHLASQNHPVAGDKEYGPEVLTVPALKEVTRHLLHAYELSFICPFTNRQTVIRSEIAPDMAEFIRKMGLKTA